MRKTQMKIEAALSLFVSEQAISRADIASHTSNKIVTEEAMKKFRRTLHLFVNEQNLLKLECWLTKD
jgi:hypothetical protein